jgi:restriction system protein
MDAKLPTYDQLMNPLLGALHALGGSGTIDEIYEKVIERESIPDEVAEKLHNPDKSNQTAVGYRLAWARTYLRKFGLLENSSRGVWSLTPAAKDNHAIDPQVVVKHVRNLDKKNAPQKRRKKKALNNANPDFDDESDDDWRDQLHQVLTQQLSPDGFERLAQRLLRESGFVQVEVTGRTGDGGIDGKGIARINGFMSFHVFFQCKKYKGSVSAGDVRDFRGAMVGRADKGLFITTGTFTSSAVKEATRDGAPPIDLIDGDHLADKLKDLGLGIAVQQVEKVTVDASWFKDL